MAHLGTGVGERRVVESRGNDSFPGETSPGNKGKPGKTQSITTGQENSQGAMRGFELGGIPQASGAPVGGVLLSPDPPPPPQGSGGLRVSLSPISDPPAVP